MEQFIRITKTTQITTTISKILDHFTLDPHVQLTEITKAQPVTIQAEAGACGRAVSIAEIAVRKLEGMFPFFLIYQYNLATQVEKKVRVGGAAGGGRDGDRRKGKSKSRLRMLRKREERRAKRQEDSELRREHHIKMREKTSKQEDEKEEKATSLSPELQKNKINKPNGGERVHDEPEPGVGSKRKRNREMEQVSDDSDDLFETASARSAKSSSSDEEDTKIHLVPSLSISISFSRLVRDGWTPQIRGG
ncbi:hypothetical protein V1525DRAFT_403997 [Lipomyces kononenkoae]|uniref:Uncharacterized protein n=1 Tax=Lipomyces kononenkoae TaxID=34357 RepID=A0ACC3T0M5_LIPKO